MNIEELRDYCLSLKGATESLPFDDRILVFSVKGKMFCATDMTAYERINVKCNPEKAIELREQYEDVIPGFHMNKKHWNSINTNGQITKKQFEKWILESYQLVVAGLTKKIQKELSDE